MYMLIYAICFSLLFLIHVSSSCLEFILSKLGWAGLAASYMLILSTLCVSPASQSSGQMRNVSPMKWVGEAPDMS